MQLMLDGIKWSRRYSKSFRLCFFSIKHDCLQLADKMGLDHRQIGPYPEVFFPGIRKPKGLLWS